MAKNKELKKNSFIEGTLISYLNIVSTKIIGVVYTVPFYAIIGQAGGVIYSTAYSLYNLFLNISTSGVPTAVSIITSEYNAKEDIASKKKAYRLSNQIVGTLGILSFLILMLFASPIAKFMLTNQEGGIAYKDVALAIRCMSLCLLIVPFLSVKRGYLQAHKYTAISSFSQVIEQFVRVGVVLAGAYIAIKLLRLGTAIGVCFALLGAGIGALSAYLYLTSKTKRELGKQTVNKDMPVDQTSVIIKRIIRVCIPITIVAISETLYNITDMKLVLVGLSAVHFNPADTEVIASIVSTWVPKICTIVSSLAMALSTTIVPHIVDSFVLHDHEGVNQKFNNAINTVLLISLPMVVGIFILRSGVYNLFYGESAFGPAILAQALITNLFYSIVMIVSMVMQSIHLGKQVTIFTMIGLLINAGFDIPFIYLLNMLHLPAYLGAGLASNLGYAFTTWMMLSFLKKKFNFQYRDIGIYLKRLILPNLAMGVVVYLMSTKLFFHNGYLLLVMSLGICGVVGALIYAILTYRNHTLQEALGEDFVRRFIRK